MFELVLLFQLKGLWFYFSGLSSHDYVLKIVPTIYEKLDGSTTFTYQYTWAYKVRVVIAGACHLARKSVNFGLKSNGKVIFWKFRSEIVEYLQRYSSFSVRNGTAEMSLPLAKLSSFQSHQPKTITGNRSANDKCHFVRLVCWFWKTLTIIQCSSQPVYSAKW